MLRIRRIYDDVLPSSRSLLAQVQTIMRQRFPDAREGEVEGLKDFLEKGFKRKKSSNIVIVAEGEKSGGAFAIAEKVKDDFKEYSVRVSILGHIQRGGTPSAYDRVMASKYGYAAVEALMDDQKSIMVGLHNNEIDQVPFSKVIKLKKTVNPEQLQMAEILSI